MVSLWRIFISDRRLLHGDKELKSNAASAFMIFYVFVAHTLWLVIFIRFAMPFMIWMNIAGLAVIGTLFAANKMGMTSAASTLGTLWVSLYGFAEVWQTGWGASGQWLIIAAFLPHYLFLQTTPKRKNMLVVITMLMLWFSCVLGTVNGVQLTAPREYILRAVNVVVISVGVLLEVRMADITAATNQKERQKYIRSLELDSQRDPLTGLWNRRYADHYFSNLPDSDRLMCFVLADIDRFKAINDTYGHNTGDEVLRFFADAMQNRFRTSDAIIRWGGEEFLIILHGISVSTGLGIINKFREHIAGQKVETDGGVIRFTATFGIAEYTPAGKTSVEDVIAQCDLCLYHGKKNGRNQTVTPDLIDQET